MELTELTRETDGGNEASGGGGGEEKGPELRRLESCKHRGIDANALLGCDGGGGGWGLLPGEREGVGLTDSPAAESLAGGRVRDPSGAEGEGLGTWRGCRNRPG